MNKEAHLPPVRDLQKILPFAPAGMPSMSQITGPRKRQDKHKGVAGYGGKELGDDEEFAAHAQNRNKSFI